MKVCVVVDVRIINVSKSIHFCSNTNRRIMSFCMVTDDEGYASRGICRRCVL